MILPEDHMLTLGQLYDILNIEVSDEIISSTDSQSSNKKIINLLISRIGNDNQLLALSCIIERLATGDVLISECPKIESFRNG